MHDDIPTFLRLTAAERRAAWRDRQLTVMSRTKAKRDWHLPATIDAAGRALARQIEKDRAARAKQGSRDSRRSTKQSRARQRARLLLTGCRCGLATEGHYLAGPLRITHGCLGQLPGYRKTTSPSRHDAHE